MKPFIPACILALAAAPACADFRYAGSKLQLYLPQLSWAVALPKDDWEIAQEKRRPDGTGLYYFASSAAKALQFSIYFDRSSACSSGAACRELWKNNSGPAFKDARDPVEFERNGFSVLHFHLDKPAGMPVVQANASAHAYRDGYWIDVRVTKVGATLPDSAALLALIDSLSIGAKALGGTRQYPVAGGRFLEFDVPGDWRDAFQPGTLPAVTFKPATGDAFQVLLTVFAPKAADAPAPTRPEILAQATDAAGVIRPSAVESSIEPREIRGRNAWGYRFTATDKAPGPGEYRHLMQGFMAAGNVRYFFTILSHDGQERAVARALEMLLSARLPS